MSRFRIASFNANSIRMRLDIVLNWMAAQECDVLCLQETKVLDSLFPVEAINAAGLNCSFIGQKSYNGVAIISPHELTDVRIGTGNPVYDEEARLIAATVQGISVVNTYLPQGTSTDSPRFQYKLDYIRSMRDYFTEHYTPQNPVVWVGDFNVAPEPIDVYDPEGLAGSVCYHPDATNALEHVREWGFVDVVRKHHPNEPKLYTFWDYRIPNSFKRKLGWRLDHIYATESLAEKSMDCWVDTEPRLLEKPSDHTFLVADFDI